MSAQEQYEKFGAEMDAEGPVDRLRFFCSFAMGGQDWCDVSPYFDAVEAELAALRADAARLNWLYTQVPEMELYRVCYPHYVIGGGVDALRAAIDAMQAAP